VISREHVPYLSALETSHYRALYESTDTLLYLGAKGMLYFSCALTLDLTTTVPCSNAAKMRNPLKLAGVPN